MLTSSTTDAVQGFLNVVVDPCLRDVGGLLQKLHSFESSSGDSGPTQAKLGIGLCKVVPALRGVVFVRENPVVGWALVAGFLGIFVGIGYRLGKRTKK